MTIPAVLASSIDSKKVTVGDVVIARTTQALKSDGKTIIPDGAKIVGHVTQASATAKGDSSSSLGIVFDKAILKHGQEMPLNLTLQAIAPPQSVAPDTINPDGGMPRAGSGGTPAAGPGRNAAGTPGGMAPATNSTIASAPSTIANADANNVQSGKGADGRLNSAGQLNSDSRGVIDLQGIGLTAGTVGAQQTTAVITSTGKNVRLDSGTQLLLVTQAARTSAAPKP
jgi:hypothetical protein